MGLTDREVQIPWLLPGGCSRPEATATLLSEHTARHHLEHIYGKVMVSTRVAAAQVAVGRGRLD
jgi:ATP/maltotriose-dependent transcriptional regulator MalT